MRRIIHNNDKIVGIIFLILAVLTGCKGNAIGDAQTFKSNNSPVIYNINAVNADGSNISANRIEPYTSFIVTVRAADPDNNALSYAFSSSSGSFMNTTSTSSGCNTIFITNNITSGQNIELWVNVSDAHGAVTRQSFNLGTGKTGPAIAASFDRIRITPDGYINLSVSANCGGFFQIVPDGDEKSCLDFKKDMMIYTFSENSTTKAVITGPKCNSRKGNIQLPKKTEYGNNTCYNLVLIFRDGMFQTDKVIQKIYVDDTAPKISAFSPSGNNVVTRPSIAITFDEEIDPSSVTSSSLSLSGGNCDKIDLVSANGKTAVFTAYGLDEYTKFTARITGIQDCAGNVMSDDSSHVFTTASNVPITSISIKDESGKSASTTYCGFEPYDATLSPIANGTTVAVTWSSDDTNNIITLTEQGFLCKITINPRNRGISTVIKIIATASNGVSGTYTIDLNEDCTVTGANDIQLIRKNLNGSFEIFNDIDLSGTDTDSNPSNGNFTPIGTDRDHAFTGTLNGHGNSIKNMIIIQQNMAGENLGFIRFNDGRITNLNIENAQIKGDRYVGALVGCNTGNVSYCNSSGIIEGGYVIGGLIGMTQSRNVNYCSSSCSVTQIDIPGEGEQQISIGGLIGIAQQGSVEYCNAEGNVTAAKAKNVGGFIGCSFSGGKITRCYAIGKVVGDINVGGFAGCVESGVTIERCYSTGGVTGITNVGGLTGCLGYYDEGNPVIPDISKVHQCYSKGSATGTTNVGGFIGYSYYSETNNCYAAGMVVPTAEGFLGKDIGNTVIKKAYHLNSSGKNSFGTGIDDLTTQTNFNGFVFGAGNPWSIDTGINGGMPYLTDMTP